MVTENFLYNLFCSTTGYTIESTTIFAIILIIFVYFISWFFKFLKIKVDKRLAIAISPYIVLGSSLRVLKDTGIIVNCLFQTPGIYFFIFSITLSLLIITTIIERKKNIPYYKIMFIIGLFLISPILGIIQYRNFTGIGYVIAYLIPWIILLKLMSWLTENKIVTGLHTFDGTVTFVSLSYFGYYEQHILPRYLINLFGAPFSFVIIKFIALVAVLWSIDRYSDDKEFNNYIKLIIGILGAATGIRDFLRLFSLV
jgi:uncharacterized membrane protein